MVKLCMFLNLQSLIRSHFNRELNITDLEIGCSFDPLHQIFFEKDIQPIDVLKYIHRKLNIKNIRLSIRWNKVWDLDFYRKYLDYCLENNLKVVLNIGPLKVMRWPEEHIPEEFKSLLNKYEVINLNHKITKPSLDYLHKILEDIKPYSKILIAIQADNELFNPFGEFSLKIQKDYELRVIEIINKFFQNIPIFVNSSGTNDIRNIFDLALNVSNQIIVGINYYYKTKYQHRIPILNKLDNLILRKPFSISPEKFKDLAEQKKYLIEVSELQGEPWWPNAKSPGNNFNEFVFTLQRTKFLKPNGQKTIVARYWGIEDFVSKFIDNSETLENQKIKDLIIKIQEGK